MAKNIKQYKLTSRIAGGGTGEVYRGRNSETKSDVAVKVFNPEVAGNPSLRKRFVTNVSRLQALKHENIIQILDALEESDGLFMVMDYVPGKPLSSLLGGRSRPMSPEIAVPYISQVLRALSHAHSEGKRHGALKPTDVIIGSDSRVRVEGFGVAELVGQGNVLRAANRAGMLPYFAPEQLRSNTQLDAKADVYSTGMMLYHLLTGALPFAPTSSTSEAQVRSAIVKKPLPDSPVFENLPPALIDVVRRATSKQREDRPTARDFLRVLQNVPSSQQPRTLAAAAAGVITGGAAAGMAASALASDAPKRVNISTAPPLTGVAVRSSGGQERLYAPQTPSGLQSSDAGDTSTPPPAKLPPSDEAAAQLREVLKNAAPQNLSPQAASQSALVEQRMSSLRAQESSDERGGGTGLGMAAGAAGLGAAAFTASQFSSDVSQGGFQPNTPNMSDSGTSDESASSLMPMATTRRFDDTAPPPDSNTPTTKDRKGSGLGALLAGGAIAGILIGGTYWYFTFRDDGTAKKNAANQANMTQEKRMKYFKDSLANTPEVRADWRDTVEPGTPLYDSLDKAERAAKALASGASPAPSSSSDTSGGISTGGAFSDTEGKQNKGSGVPSIFGGGNDKENTDKSEKSEKKKIAAQNDDDSPLSAIKKASGDAVKKSSGAASNAIPAPANASPKTSSNIASNAPSNTASNAPSNGSQQRMQVASQPSKNGRTNTTGSSRSSSLLATKESAQEIARETKKERAERLKQEQKQDRAEKIAARRAASQAKLKAKREAQRNTATSSKASKSSNRSSAESLTTSRTIRKRSSSSEEISSRNRAMRSKSTASRAATAQTSNFGIAERNPDEMPSSANNLNTSEIMTLRGHLGSVQSVSFSPDGKLLASGGVDKTVKIWDVATGKIIRSMRGHAKGVTTVFFSPDGKFVMSGSKDKTVKVWNVDTGERMQSTAGITCSGSPTAFSPDGTLLATTRNKLITLAKIHSKNAQKP